jgi:methanethiol S-methyltransferase
MTNTGFWWIILACGLYAVLHSLLASRSIKARAARRFGPAVYQRYYRLFFSLMALVTTTALLALVWLLPDQVIYTIPVPWLYLTLLAQGLALAALVLGILQTGAMRFLGVRQVLEQTGKPSAERLIITGFYRWVRHPLYIASIVFIWLMPLMTWNLLALNLGLSSYMLIGTIFEEQKLVDQFGADYERYRRQTPRILPGLRSRYKTNPLEEESSRG